MTNMLARLNQELEAGRTLVVRIFPNTASCLRLSRALAIETHEGCLEAIRYLNMEHLKEHKKRSPQSLGRMIGSARESVKPPQGRFAPPRGGGRRASLRLRRCHSPAHSRQAIKEQ